MSKDNLNKIELLEKDLVDINYIKDALIDFTDNDFKIDWDYRIFEKFKYNDKYVFAEAKFSEYINRENMEYILMPDREYFMGFTIIIYSPQTTQGSSEDLKIPLKRTIKLLNDNGFKFLRIIKDIGVFPKEYEFHTLQMDNIEISNRGIYAQLDDKELTKIKIDTIDIFFVDESKNFSMSTKEIFEHYGWKGYSIDENDKIYFDIKYEDIVPYIISNSDKYVNILSGDDIDLGYYSVYYAPSNDEIFSYLNEEVIKKTIVYIKDKYGYSGEYEDGIKSWKWWKKFDSHLSIMTKNNDPILSEMKKIIADYSSQAHEYKNIQEIEDQFESKMSDMIKYEIFHKNSEKRIKVYFDPEWINDLNPQGSNTDLIDFFNEWSYNIRTELNPKLSDYGDVDKNEISSEILHLFK